MRNVAVIGALPMFVELFEPSINKQMTNTHVEQYRGNIDYKKQNRHRGKSSIYIGCLGI